MSVSTDTGIIIIGAGGHGRVVAEALRADGYLVLGFTDRNPAPTESATGPRILGDDGVLKDFDAASVRLALGIGSTRPGNAREKIYDRLRSHGFSFATVTHPSAVIAEDVVLEDGCQIMAGAVIQPGCRIGAGTIVNTRASIDHDCTLGRFVHVAPGATLSGGVTLGDGSHVGAGATIIQNVSVGARAFVKAGTVVTGNIARNERNRAPND